MSVKSTIKYNGTVVTSTTGDSIAIVYNGVTKQTITSAGTMSLNTEGCLMQYDVVTGDKTLKTAGCLMQHDIDIVTETLSYKITPTLTNVTADAGNPTTINAGESVTLTFTADEGYTLPETVTVTGATATWKTWMVYDITGTSTNCYFDEALTQTTYTGTCDEDKSVTINIYADGSSYAVPTTLTVTGGTYSKISNSHATLVIENPTEDIDFTTTGLTTTAAPTNLSVSDTTLTFDPVDDATSYEVYAKDSSGVETDLGEYTPA